jgi:hypothetical protein
MRILRKVFDFYIKSSIHVALSCFSLVRISQHDFNISTDFLTANFAFFGTIVGYNFVKYEALVRAKKNIIRLEIKAIAFLSLLSLILVGFYFFQLQRISQIIAFVLFILTLLYTIPFFPNRRNARNWAGLKIYIVALCWVGVTLILPVLNANIAFTTDFYLHCVQRFILIFVLILIFEIIDLYNDDPLLQTVPQQIGVRRTKNLGYVLLMLFSVLEFFKSNFQLLPLIFEIVIFLFLAFANEKHTKYYTSFWVEGIPILWWLILFFIL